DSLKRSDQLTKGMVSILSSLEGRLEHLENSVIPMHDSTQNLLQLKGTTQKTLFYLDDAISHYQAVRDTDKVIIQGPTGRLSDYLACVHRLKKAEEYFQQEDPDGPELNMLVQLIPQTRLQDIISISTWLIGKVVVLPISTWLIL
uniref:Uncharacterized protein n=1 Tax=Oncorhynchus mykiss TaxID=8022 RepID=A0A8C7P4A4_ONCMY